MRIITVICLLLVCYNCIPIDTNDAEEAYQYWSGQKPSPEIELLEGQYYQSPHFSLEYEVYLKFKASDIWWFEYTSQNSLEIDSLNLSYRNLDDFPDWFNPTPDFTKYSMNDNFDRSVYFYNPNNGLCYIFETVGL